MIWREIQRNDMNSVGTDLCYDAEHHPFGYTFFDYKGFLLTASSQVGEKAQTTPEAPSNVDNGTEETPKVTQKILTETGTDYKETPTVTEKQETSVITATTPVVEESETEEPTDLIQEKDLQKKETPTEEITEESKKESTGRRTDDELEEEAHGQKN
jgi:hypothetical protein